MNRSSHFLVVALAAGLFPFLVFWDGFPMLPVLDGCITAASALLGHHCLVSQRLPASQAAQAVPEDVRRRWCRVLGILFLTNAALAPLGFLLWNILRLDVYKRQHWGVYAPGRPPSGRKWIGCRNCYFSGP